MADSPQIKLPFTISHSFIVGINDYEHVNSLTTAVNDAIKLAEKLEADHGYQVHPPLLNATKAEMEKLLLETMPKQVGPEDRVLFYFAGHGIALNSDDDPQGYFVPADARGDDPDTLVSMDLLHDIIDKLPCQHGLLIMDCCFAGSFKWSTGHRSLLFDLPAIIYEERFYQYAQDPAWQVITSSASDQKAVDILSNRTLGLRNDPEAVHSPFAQALLDGLDGAADTIPKEGGDGVITTTELYTYLRDRVEDITMDQGSRQSPSMFSLHKHDKGQYIFLHPRHRLNLPPTPDRNPFMGLKSFEEEDSLLFFGRDRVVEQLTQMAQDHQLVVVSGVSGTGKSSVIKAGLLPLMRKKGCQILPVIRPGEEPMQSLKEEVLDLLMELPSDQSALLIVDQYEELITQCQHEEERFAFEEELADWLQKRPKLHIVISVRADFEPQFERGALRQWWEQGRYMVPIFNSSELREVIVKPTIQEVLFFEPHHLIDKLIDAVNQAPGALPLLSFTLSELYHAYINSGRTNRAFTLEDYEKLGGVIGALRTRANAIYDGLDIPHQNSMRKLMLRMVSLEGGELASRRVQQEDLSFSDPEETERVLRVAHQLVDARLIATGREPQGQTYFEPAHDALIRAWARLWEWVKAIGDGKLSLMYKLSLAVEDHQEHLEGKTSKSYLWNKDPRLGLLFSDLRSPNHHFNALESDFLRKSMRLRKRNVRRRRWIAGAAIAILFAFSIISFGLYQNAEERTIYAEALAKAANIRNLPSREGGRALEEIKGVYAANPLPEVSQAMASQFYAQFGEEKGPLRPLYIREFSKHTGRVRSAVFSPDGKKILTASEDQTAKLWSFEGDLLANFTGHIGHLQNAVFSPDGKYILTASLDSTAKLWNLKGELLIDLDKHTERVWSAVFSPDSKKILTASIDQTAKLWNLKGDLLADLDKHTGPVLSASFSSDGQRIVTASVDNTAKLWNLDGDLLADLDKHTNYVYTAVFSPDNQQIITASRDGTAKLWDLKGKLLVNLDKHTNLVRSARFSPDGRKILTASFDNTVKIWNLKGELIADLDKHEAGINSAVFSPDGRQILTASDDHVTRLWTAEGEPIAVFDKHTDQVYRAVFSPDGNQILTASFDRTAKLWSLKGELLANLNKHTGGIFSAVFSPEGKQVLTASNDKTAKLWSLKGELLTNLNQHTEPVTSAVFSPNGQQILTSSYDSTAKLWSLNGDLVVDFGKHKDLVWAADFSPNGKHILIRSNDRVVKLWNPEGELVLDLSEYSEGLIGAIFSKDSNHILTTSDDNSAKIWSLVGELRVDFVGHNGWIWDADFSPDGKHVVTASFDSTAKLWNLQGELLTDLAGHTDRVFSAVFSPDNKQILTASEDGTAKLWTLAGELLADFNKHTDRVFSASFSPDGKQILTASEDETVKLWNLEGELLADLDKHTDGINSAIFSPNGKFILSASDDFTAKLWPTPNQIFQHLVKTAQ
jgi:WD40 repeat protein